MIDNQLMMIMKVIEVKGLTKKYGDFTAVDNISFSVEEGKLFAFLGENGAGKSTTINILCTILEKSGGEVTICGNRLGIDDNRIREAIGIVFQNSVLDNKLTVKENLYTRGAYYGLSKKEIDERLAPFSKKFEMDEIWNRKYEKLSGGQRRRVDIMRALINNPKILFLDEPTTGLDPKSRKIVWDYIDYLRKEKGMTIFLTTHYMEETKDADEVIILDHGKIVAKGTPQELKSMHARTRLVWYKNEGESTDELLNDAGVEYTYNADHYTIYSDDGFIDFLYKYREVIRDFEIIKGSMDDVFLKLTGKELM